MIQLQLDHPSVFLSMSRGKYPASLTPSGPNSVSEPLPVLEFLANCHAWPMPQSTMIQEYEGQRLDAVRQLFQIQKLNKGWGLRPGSESSLVNTAEALNVIAAEGQMEDERAQAAVGFLLRALRLHYRPESEDPAHPSRGLNIRYLTFCLDGLITSPDTFATEEGIDAVTFCLKGIRAAQHRSGGVQDEPTHKVLSYHQTGRALAACSKLLISRVALPEGLTRLARTIADDAAAYLLAQQMEDGPWRATPLEASPLSPAKTAIANTSLAYYRLLTNRVDYLDQQKTAADWLLAERKRWFRTTSNDPQEAQTAWEHLDYAECLRGVAAGRSDAWPQLRTSWAFLLRQWSDQNLLWAEPKGNETIRAAYHTVMAFETVLPTSRLIVPAAAAHPALEFVVRIVHTTGARFEVMGKNDRFALDLGRARALVGMLVALVEEPNGVDAEILGRRLGVGTASLLVYEGRINEAVRAASAGRVHRLVRHRDGVFSAP